MKLIKDKIPKRHSSPVNLSLDEAMQQLSILNITVQTLNKPTTVKYPSQATTQHTGPTDQPISSRMLFPDNDSIVESDNITVKFY